jgi:hypothetical protein
MRSAGNFHPEWGYLAPAPSFLRTVRIALVATAIGAVAGAVVVVSLIERPKADTENSSIASHALVGAVPVSVPAVAAAPVANPAAAAQSSETTQSASQTPGPQPSTTATASVFVPSASANAAAVDQTSAAQATSSATETSDDTATGPEGAKKSGAKKHHVAATETHHNQMESAEAKKKWRESRGFAPLLHLFSFRTGSANYPN